MPLTRDELNFLKELFQSLDEKPLEPTDRRYVRLYEQYEEADPVEIMARAINFSGVQSRQFFSGFRGSGKSTQLFRLKKKLEGQDYLVLYADALNYINPALPIDISDLLVLLAGAFSDAAEDKLGLGIAGEGYWDRFKNFLLNTKVEIEGLELAAPGGAAKIKAAFKDTPSFRQKLQDILPLRLSELERQVHRFFEEYVQALNAKADPAGIVFLFDNLERLRGSLSTEQEVIASVQRLFDVHLDRLSIPYVHIVYSVPPWVTFILPASDVKLLPSIVQWKNDPQRTPDPKGDSLLLSVIRRRFREEGFLRFFGEEARANQFVQMCGGNIRDLIRLLRDAILRAGSLPITDEVMQSSIRTIREQFLPIPTDDAFWLWEIAKRRQSALPNANPQTISRFSLFLDTHLVLFLRNGDEWYDVHPLIREQVEQIAKVEAERAAKLSIESGSGE